MKMEHEIINASRAEVDSLAELSRRAKSLESKHVLPNSPFCLRIVFHDVLLDNIFDNGSF